MRIVMGAMNGVGLFNLMHEANGQCSRVTAAVAYANNERPFFEFCIENNIFVEFYGLLDADEAVSVALLDRLLRSGPLAVKANVIKGHFHSKVIWWHGFGVYIGSANLTSSGWFANVECGMFLSEDEVIGSAIGLDLEHHFDYLRDHSSPVTTELIRALSSLQSSRQAAFQAKKKVQSQFELATGGIPPHAGLSDVRPGTRSTAFTRFTTEWNATLQLLRGLRENFQQLDRRPVWIAADADPTVHFDQFLHAYYYDYVRAPRDDEENAKNVELVNRAFEANRGDPRAALEKAADWWASLHEAPYGEDKFVRDIAPVVRQQFEPTRLASWSLEDFQRTFYEVHAFKMHARQVRNAFFGLPAEHHETLIERTYRLAQWLWEREREPSQKHVIDLLQFLVWAKSPADMAERLWVVTKDPDWRYERLGPSSLGEAVGWARPDMYPPRNNRTNKALRCLGHNIKLFSD